MESLISDKDVMDPEVVVPQGASHTSTSVLLALWHGLPQSWALAMLLVSSVAVVSWNLPVCLLGLTTAAIVACIGGCCGGLQKTWIGAWLRILHHCCSLAGLVGGLRTTLQYMAGDPHHSWLSRHMGQCPRLTALMVLAFITMLVALGLERSRILRNGLLACVPITLIMMVVGGLVFNTSFNLAETLQEPIVINKVVESAAFFTVVFSGTVWQAKPDTQLSLSSFAAVKMMFISCIVAIFFFYLSLDKRNVFSGEALLINILEKNNESKGAPLWWIVRDGLAVASMTSLSLSLVEGVAFAQHSVVSVSGIVIPAWMAREHWWTGTQLSAIGITGLVSAVLLFLPLQSLIALSSASCLLSHASDLISALYQSYQPSFVPKNSGMETEGGSYQLLSDVTGEDSETELSDDSGHSSDTDIDAAVHEYQQTVKVATMMEESKPVPTVRTARIATWGLVAIVLACLGTAGALTYSHVYISLFNIFEVLLIIYMISRQPQETNKHGSIVWSPWHPCIALALHILLATLLIPQVWVALIIWSTTGLLLWLCQKRRQWSQLKTRLRRQADRVNLPRASFHTSFQPSYHKLSHMDTVNIVR